MKFETDSKEFRLVLNTILDEMKSGIGVGIDRLDSIFEFNKEQRGLIIDLASDFLDFLKEPTKEKITLTTNINDTISAYMNSMLFLLLFDSYDHEDALKVFKNQILLIREMNKLKALDTATKENYKVDLVFGNASESIFSSFFDTVEEEHDFESFESIIEENLDLFLSPRCTFLPLSNELQIKPSLQKRLPFSLGFLQRNHQYLTFDEISSNQSVMDNPEAREFVFNTVLRETMDIIAKIYLGNSSIKAKPPVDDETIENLKLIWKVTRNEHIHDF